MSAMALATFRGQGSHHVARIRGSARFLDARSSSRRAGKAVLVLGSPRHCWPAWRRPHVPRLLPAHSRFALNDDQALQVLTDWNARCQPPWSLEELLDKLRRAACTAASRLAGCSDSGKRDALERRASPGEASRVSARSHGAVAGPATIKACARTDEPSARVAPGRTGRLSSRGRDRYRLRLCTSEPESDRVLL